MAAERTAREPPPRRFALWSRPNQGARQVKTGWILKTVSEVLQQAIRKSDQTLYRIAKDAEIDWGTLQRFLDGSRPSIRIDTVDKLCRHLGLELRPVRERAKSSRAKRRR